MKKLLLFLFVTGVAVSVFSQHSPFLHKVNTQTSPYIQTSIADPIPGLQPPNVYVSNRGVLDDFSTCVTKYDLQSNNTSGQQRIYLWPDGKICTGATWSQQETGYTDRGTGYNFYDGAAWGPQPGARQESVRTGWPSLQPYGPNGEALVCHQSATLPMKFLKRSTRGTGVWTESDIPTPAPATGMLWPRMVTNGPDHTYIHIIAITAPVANGGVVYNGMDGALLYINSMDGGDTWGSWQQLDGMTSTEYLNFTADIYAWAQPQGNTIAFTVGDSWQDQILMKSLDNGTTWTKTVIWPCPYNFWAGGDSVPRYYCPDGTMSIALDQQGMAHIVMGLQQGSGDVAGGKYWVPYTDGVLYWNEYMPTWPAVLDPQTLYDNGNYIGGVKDTTVFYPTNQKLAAYYCSMTSNSGITIDAGNNLFVIWSGVTTLVDPDDFWLRHIIERTASIQSDHSIMWHDSLTDLTSDFLQYNWTECMYPNIAPNSDSKIYVLFQGDDLAGCYVKSTLITGYSGQTSITENNMIVLNPDKTDLYVGTGDKKGAKSSFTVSKNYPNPVIDLTTVNVNIQKPGNLILEVTNLMGQNLISMEKVNLPAGIYRFVIDGSQLSSGAYFYTVKLNNESITNKMIVE